MSFIRVINISFLIVTTISFNQSTYSVYENNGPVQPVLVLSNPLSVDIDVQVRDSSVAATRKSSVIII